MDGGQPTMRLAFEAPDTDHQPLGLDCLKGSGVVSVDHQSSGTGLTSLSLASDEVSRAYPVKAEAEEMGGGEFLTADIPADDPVLIAFRRTGWLTLTVDGRSRGLASHPDGGGKGRIEDFFAFCSAEE